MIMNERSMVEELLNRPPYDGSEECDNLFIEALRDELVFHYEHNEMYRHFVRGRTLILMSRFIRWMNFRLWPSVYSRNWDST